MTILKKTSEVFHEKLRFNVDGTILSVTFEVTAKGLETGPLLVAALVANASPLITISLSGGVDGEIYGVTVKAETDTGEILEQILDVHIADFTFSTPGISGAYLSAEDYINRVGFEETLTLTDDGYGRINREKLLSVIADCEAECNANLSSRYLVPLTPVPPLLISILVDLVRFKLSGDHTTDNVEKAAVEARKQLLNLAKGVLKLESAAQKTVAESTVQFSASSKVMTKTGLGYF